MSTNRTFKIKNIISRFVCTVCGKRVARSGDLAVHMRSHTGERPYACTLCPKRYRMSCHLATHMNTHTGERPYSCVHCGKSFAYYNVLRTHSKIHGVTEGDEQDLEENGS